MPFKFVSKPIFAAALAVSAGVYVIAKTAWAGLDEAGYMNPFLLMTIYIFYVWLIIPFNVKYPFLAVRNPNFFEYKLTFIMKLAANAALYWGLILLEIAVIGPFINDDFVAGRMINYFVHMFLNFNLFNILYAAMCDKLKLSAARTLIFALPVFAALLNHFGSGLIYKLNFLYFGMRSVSVLNAVAVYIIVFGGGLFFLLKKGKREYV